MNAFEIINLLVFTVLYVIYGISCAYIGYKKGSKKGYGKGASFICKKIREIINHDADDTLAQLVTWVSTDERLPICEGLPQEYLVMIDGFTYPTTLRYSAEEGFYDENGDELVHYKVTWWAALPLAPGEEPDSLSVNGVLALPKIGDTVYSVMLNDLDDDGGYHIESWVVYGVGISKDCEPIVISWDGETYILDDEKEGLSFSTLEKAEQHLEKIQARNEK